MKSSNGNGHGSVFAVDEALGFTLPALHARGRLVRLAPVLVDIHSNHNYPPLIERVLAEELLPTALLGTTIQNAEGQLTNGTYLGYCMPRAADLPMFKVGNHVTACTHNPLGIKGVGEVGAIGVPPAVINAVLDALAPLGVTDISMPATPEKVWRAIQAAKKGA